MSKLFATTDWHLIHGIGTEHIRGIPVASRVVAIGVIEVLPIVSGGTSLRGGAPRTVVSVIVGHALLETVRNLSFQAMAKALLQYSLQCVIVHVANRGGVLHITETVRSIGQRSCGNPIYHGPYWILTADQRDRKSTRLN